MKWNYTCEFCGANLDPGEKCDCMDAVHKKIHLKNKERNNYMEERKYEPIRD